MLPLRSLRFALLAGVGTTAILAACSGNNNYNPPNQPCGAPSGQLAVAYPAPNATGIPDNLQGIVFASTSGLTASYQAVIVPSGSQSGTYFNLVAPAPSPLPSPYATPPFANPIYQESATPLGLVLPADTTIGVYLNDAGSNCTPTKLLSTFTTQ